MRMTNQGIHAQMVTVKGDELIGVPRATAADVIGVSERRLSAWNTSGLVLPSLVTRVGRRVYWSYQLEDLVQGRVVRQLEDRRIDIRIIRSVVEAVRSSTHPHPLASLRWATSNGEVYVGYPDGQWVGGRRPAQGVIPDVLDLEQIRADARRGVSRSSELAGQVERRRGTLGSKQVFSGTRVPLAAVATYLRRNIPDDQILEAFPDLTYEDIEFARREIAASA